MMNDSEVITQLDKLTQLHTSFRQWRMFAFILCGLSCALSFPTAITGVVTGDYSWGIALSKTLWSLVAGSWTACFFMIRARYRFINGFGNFTVSLKNEHYKLLTGVDRKTVSN